MRILCFGDSNTYGYDPRGFFADRYPPECRWVDLTAQLTGHEFLNFGSNGRQIPRTGTTLPDCDLLLVMLGTNDLLSGTAPKEAAAQMEGFLRACLPHRRILLVTPPPMKRGAWVGDEALVQASRELAAEYELLAKKLGIPYADTRNWNIDLAFDGIHFTEKGHRDFARRLSNCLL